MGESIASLKRRKADLTAEKDDLKKRIKSDNIQINKLDVRISKIKNRINGNTDQLTVSDHAMLRYCERVLGMNIVEMRKTIVKGTKVHTVNFGDGIFKLPGDFNVCVKGNVVVTVTN